jgi:cytochrome c oxidase subunit 4
MAHNAHTTAGHGTHDDHPLVGHLVPISTLVLTVITVAVRYIDVGEFNIWIAIGIAVVKATLVALFFMHLRWDRPFNLLVFIGCIAFVVLMMAFCIMDTSQYRKDLYTGNPSAAQETLEKYAPGAPALQVRRLIAMACTIAMPRTPRMAASAVGQPWR